MINALWGFKKIASVNYPVVGAQGSAGVQTVNVDIKNFLQKETLSRIGIRLFGNIVVAGAGAGTATGRDNPEALLTNVILRTNPSLGVMTVNNLSARGLLRRTMYERGYLIKAASVADTAGTTAIDVTYIINLKQPGAINPIEYSLPLAMFESVLLQLSFGGRDQLFTGGTNTWDATGLQIQIWADYDDGVAGEFHVTEIFERQFAISATQSDFPINTLEPGYMYQDMLFRTEGALVLVNNILNSITLQSAGRVWLPQGDTNALEIQRWNRETNLSDPNVTQTGLYFVPLLRDGMYTRAVDALDTRLDMKLDVTTQANAVVIITGRRIIPLGLKAIGVQPSGVVSGAVSAAAATS